MATSEIKPIANGAGAGVLSQAEYELLLGTTLANGLAPGILPRVWINKILRQTSVLAAALAKYAADTTGVNVVDNGDVDALAALFGSAVSTTSGLLPVDTVTGASYTLVAADLNRCKRFTSASAITVTVPAGVGIIPGFNCILRQAGAGLITVNDSAVDITTPTTLVSSGQNASLFLHKVGTDLWDLTGDLAP